MIYYLDLDLDVPFFNATMYYLLPNRFIKPAITKVGMLMAKKFTVNTIGY